MIRLISHLFNAAAFVSLAALSWNLAAENPKQIELRNYLAGMSPRLAIATGETRPAEQATVGGSGQTSGAAVREVPAVESRPPAQAIAPAPIETSSIVVPQNDSKAPAASLSPGSPAAPAAVAPRDVPGQVLPFQPRETQAAAVSAAPAESVRAPEPSRPVQAVAGAAARATAVRAATGDVIVPPIRRQKPSAVATSGKAKPKATTARPAKQSAATTKVLASTRANAIMLPDRSTLSAGRVASPAAASKAACKEGLRFDKRMQRCLPLPTPTAATPLRVRGAAAQ